MAKKVNKIEANMDGMSFEEIMGLVNDVKEETETEPKKEETEPKKEKKEKKAEPKKAKAKEAEPKKEAKKVEKVRVSTQSNDEILSQLPETVTPKVLDISFNFNDGGKTVRRHLRNNFAELAAHGHGDKWGFNKNEDIAIDVIEYFADRYSFGGYEA